MKILFVCTGNTCRSPMAEAIARRVAADRGFTDIEVGSAGTGAHGGSGASEGALLVGLERGLDLNTHRARVLTPALLAEYDIVLAMGTSHLQQLEQMGAGSKTHLLTAYASNGTASRSVADPFGGSLDTYRETFEELEREIRLVFDRLAAERAPDTP